MELSQVSAKLAQIDPHWQSGKLRPLDVSYLYRLLLGRAPDAQGWGFWNSQVDRSLPLREALDAFFAAPEARARWFPQPQRVETKRGFAIFVDPSDETVCGEILETGDYEPEVSGFLEHELRGARGTFLDIGSNIGWFLMLARKASPELKVIGFEPNPANVTLSYRSLQHGGHDDATVFAMAASDRSGFLGLTYAGTNGQVGAQLESAITIVQGVRGDDILRPGEPVCLLKIDVEGHEPLAIQGLDATLRASRPVIVSEFHPHCLRANAKVEPTAYLEMLRGYGYDLSVIAPNEKGREIACNGPAAVIELYERHNANLRRKGEVHINIVARPRPA